MDAAGIADELEALACARSSPTTGKHRRPSLARWRAARGWSGRELARRAGVTLRTAQRLEALGPLDGLAALRLIELGVPVSVLLGSHARRVLAAWRRKAARDLREREERLAARESAKLERRSARGARSRGKRSGVDVRGVAAEIAGQVGKGPASRKPAGP